MTQSLSLYTLEDGLMQLLEMSDESEGDQQLALLQEIAQVTDAAIEKRRNVRGFLLWLQGQQAMCKAERDRISVLEAHYAATEKRVSVYVAGVIEQFAPKPPRGSKKLECEPGTLSLRKNPDSTEITDEMAVPEDYKVLTITIPARLWAALVETERDTMEAILGPLSELKAESRVEKRAVKAAIEAGEKVPGAAVKTGGQRLVIS
jgi:hypothetical protein